MALTVSDEMPLWPYCSVVHCLYLKGINNVLVTHSITNMSPLKYKLRLEVFLFTKYVMLTVLSFSISEAFVKFGDIARHRLHMKKMHNVQVNEMNMLDPPFCRRITNESHDMF